MKERSRRGERSKEREKIEMVRKEEVSIECEEC
jgi:hypothetical protein